MSAHGGGGGGGGRTRVGRYELGRTLGEGTFAKVKFARNVETGENVAIKILDKDKVLRHKMIAQVPSSCRLLLLFSLFCSLLFLRPRIVTSTKKKEVSFFPSQIIPAARKGEEF